MEKGGLSLATISLKNLTFSYEGSYEILFDRVSLDLDTSWKLGLVGRNGKGKTTFLKILLGELPYIGSLQTPISFQYFPYEVSNIDLPTSEIIQEIAPHIEEWQWLKEFSLLDLPPHVSKQVFSTLSSGEQTKVLLVSLFLNQEAFLLIDEPTNHLDRIGRKVVGEYLQKKKGFIVVSHDRHFLDCCINHVLVLNRSTIEIQKGTFSSWWANKERKDQYEIEENQKLRSEIRELRESARRTAQWSDRVESTKFGERGVDRGYIGHKAAKMMRKSKNTEKRMERSAIEKEKLLKDVESNESLKIFPVPYTKEVLVDVRDFSLKHQNRQIFDAIHFTLRRGDRVALVGKNGSGKSTFIRWLIGEEIASQGFSFLGSQIKISYVPQNPTAVKGLLRHFIENKAVDETLVKTILRKMGFERSQFDRNLEEYSFGQRKKLWLAMSLCEQAHLYIWDEPLNYLDVFSRMQIEELLLKVRPTILFVEHDESFVENVATKVLSLQACQTALAGNNPT